MELITKFVNLTENLSTNFPDLDKFYLYIHILGYISGFDKPLHFFSHSDIAPIVSLINFDKKIIQKIEETLTFPIERLSENEKKDLCKYFLEICLQFERSVENSPADSVRFLDDLFLSEPQAVSKNNSWYSVNFPELSKESQKKYVDWEIERYFYYKTPLIPKYLIEKAVTLATPKDGRTVYDPNCNIGSICVEFYNKFPDLNFNFKGVVRNQYEWLLCIVNLYVNGIFDDKRVDIEIEVSSPFEDVPKRYFEFKSEDEHFLREEFADVAIVVVPFAETFSEDELDSRFFGLSYSLKKPEYAYIELMLNATRDTGKAIAIVPDSVLYSSEGRFFREAYLSRDWIESVFSLPENSFNQAAFSDVSIVVFNKNKVEKNVIIFDGEGSKFERTEVKTDTVLSETDIDLRAAHYALKEIKDIRNTIERRREEKSANLPFSPSEEIKLHQYFDNLAETFSIKFPTVKNTVYLYLLLVVMMILDRGNQWFLPRPSLLINSKIYEEIEAFIYENYYKQIIDIVLDDLVNRDLFSGIKTEDLIIDKYGIEGESSFKNAFRALCKYLIAKCLQIENKVTFREVEGLWKEIAKREPKAIQLKRNGASKIDFSEFSDSTYQELSEAFIAQSFSFEENYLQRFDRLDETLAKIANPKPKQEIFNPNCGIGSLFIELQKQFPNHDLRFTGRVDDSFFYILCRANLLAHNVDALIRNEEILDADIELTFFGEMPDIALGITPVKIELAGKRDKKFFPLSHKRKNIEYSFIELMVNSVNENGKAIVVVPESFLYRWHARGFKKEYLNNDWVESIISLPEGIFKEYSSVKTSIVVFNKNKAEKGFIVFKSEDEQFEETKISLNEVLSLDRLDLRVSRYSLKEAKELKKILENTTHHVIRIKDIVQRSISGYNYSPDNRIVENSSGTLPYVRVKDLSNNDKDFTFDVSKVERKISIEKAHKRTVINFSAVLVSKIAPKLKPTYFNFTGQPIVIGSDVLALKLRDDVINKDITIEYFLTQLYSRLVQIQVEMMSSGNIINRISREDFLNIQIILPPLIEQQLQVFEMIADIEEKAVAREAVERAEKKTRQTEYELIASVAHNFKNKLSPVVMDYAILVDFLREANEKNEPIKFDTLVRPVFEGEKLEEADTLEKVINRLEVGLKTLPKVFNDFQILQKGSVSKTIVELNEYFQGVVKNCGGANYKIKVITSSEPLFVELDEDAFGSVIDNLIANAKEHAFAGEKHNYQIIFELSEVESKNSSYARILYKDNGEGFPANVSFESYRTFGSKSVYSKGSGIGGFIVNKMIELHGGEVSLLRPENSFDEYKSQIEILLPLDF